jgi:hypothetical protein
MRGRWTLLFCLIGLSVVGWLTIILVARISFTVDLTEFAAGVAESAGLIPYPETFRNGNDGNKKDKQSRGFVFLKTHKTAGSTMSRILFRKLCRDERQRCFLPTDEHPGHTWNFENAADIAYIKNMTGQEAAGGAGEGVGSSTLDVWLHHAVYSPKVLNEIVPTADYIVSIVRKPSLRFQSAWQWYGLANTTQTTLSNFISRMSRLKAYIPDSLISAAANVLYSLHYRTGLDATTMELTGIMNNWYFGFCGKEHFLEMLRRLQNRKLFLLVADRFDESVVVLATLKGWPLHQLFYFPNKVSSGYAETLKTAEMAEQAEDIQPYDSLLFKTANFMLDRYLSAFPSGGTEGIRHRVLAYQRGLSKLSEYCSAVCWPHVHGAYTDLLLDQTVTAATPCDSSVSGFLAHREILHTALNKSASLRVYFSSASAVDAGGLNKDERDRINEVGTIVSLNMCRALAMDNKDAIPLQRSIREKRNYHNNSDRRTKLETVQMLLDFEDTLLTTFLSG